MNITELKAFSDREVELIEKAAQRAGMVSLMNHGAASCVYSEGCAGVTQEHLIAFAREIALHCAAALYQPHLEDAQGEIRALRATEQNLRERVKALEEGLKKIKRGIDDELDQDWTCNSYHPNLIKAEVIARALLEQKP